MLRSPLICLCSAIALLGLGCAAAGTPPSPETDGAAAVPQTVQVTLTNDGCTAVPASAPAGPVTFSIKNTGGDKVTEVELVKGELIVGEKENLAPGLSGSFSVNLPAGDYELFCPDAQVERTKFVLQTTTAKPAPVRPEVRAAFDQAVSSYRSYVQQESAQLTTTTEAFTQAVIAGDIARAKDLYADARVHFERIEPVAEGFGDLDPAIDMRADDAADDPSKFTGFHRIEKALWEDGTVDGMTPVANQLVANVHRLQALVQDAAAFTFEPWQIANGSTELLDEVANGKITGEEERYSKLDLLDMAANIEGSRKGFDLLQPGLKMVDATLADTIASRFAELNTAIAPYKRGDGWVTYDQLQPADIKALAQAVNDLSEPLSQVAARVVVASGGDLDHVAGK